jgi:hypothetical protein
MHNTKGISKGKLHQNPNNLRQSHPFAGTKFFPGYVSDRRRAAVDQAAVAWQEEGRRRMRLLARTSLAQEQAIMLPERATGKGLGAIR